jgi:hypothetical protein
VTWTARWCSRVMSVSIARGAPGTSPSTSGQPQSSSPSQPPPWRPPSATRPSADWGCYRLALGQYRGCPAHRTSTSRLQTRIGHQGRKAPRHAPSQFPSHSLLFTTVHGRSRAAFLGWSGTLAAGGAHYSKACEGASLPWVQIPPPPLWPARTPILAAGSGCLGLPWAHLVGSVRNPNGLIGGLSRRCRAWSRSSRTTLNTSTHAAEACALPFRAGRDRPRPAGSPSTYKPHHTE